MAALIVVGLDKAQRRAAEQAARLRDMTPIMNVGAQALATEADNSFSKSRYPTGASWAPLQPQSILRRLRSKRSTRRALRKGGFAAVGAAASLKPLIKSGFLRGTVTAFGRPKAIAFGALADYAAAHQFGTKFMVARPFLPVEKAGGQVRIMATPTLAKIREQVKNWVLTGRLR